MPLYVNINNVSTLFPTFLPPANTASSTASANTNTSTASSVQSDSSTLSPATSFLNGLQQLEQQNPTQFQQVLSQITNQLEQGATAATNSGNTTEATALNNLATAFQNAQNGGALPTAQELQQAGLTGNGHHHHHHGGGGGQSSLTSLLQSSNTNDSQTLASSIFGSISSAGGSNAAASIFNPSTAQSGL
jgi:hypothetical protein